MSHAVEKILIIDDQAQFRRALRVALGVNGYEVREAGNATDALNLMRTEIPDLVLLDWQMQGLDGLQTCGAIRDRSDVPIIMVTSKPGGRSQALAAGAIDYLTKPFSVEDLLACIKSALHQSRSAH